MTKLRTYGIEARLDDRFKVEVTTGARTLYVDQPAFAGGADAGASPIDHLFASLAGCIATTARIIANQQKLPLNGMDIKIDGALDLDILSGKSTAGRPGINGINIRVALDSDMSALERQGFLEALRSRCPVYDTIAAATSITMDSV